MLRTPSACAPRRSDSSPAIVESRGVWCGIVSSPTNRSIATAVMIPLMRARARGLSLMSTKCAAPASLSAWATSSTPAFEPPSGGSSWTDTTHSPSRSIRVSSVSRGGCSAIRGSSRSVKTSAARGSRASSTAPRIAAISAGVVPRPPPMILAPRLRACAANSAKYSGEAAGHAREADVRKRGERQPVAAHLLDRAECGLQAGAVVGPNRGDVELAEPLGRLARRDARERLRVALEREQCDDREARDAPHGLDGDRELVEVEEGLDHEQVDPATLEDRGLLGEELGALLGPDIAEVAERADGARDEDVSAGDLAGLAGQADGARVDLLEILLEKVTRELAPVRAERVGLDQLRSGADEADVERDDRLGGAEVGLLRRAEAGDRARHERTHAAVPDDRRPGAQACDEAVVGGHWSSWFRSTSSRARRPAGLGTLPEAGCRGFAGPVPSASLDAEREYCPAPGASVAVKRRSQPLKGDGSSDNVRAIVGQSTVQGPDAAGARPKHLPVARLRRGSRERSPFR